VKQVSSRHHRSAPSSRRRPLDLQCAVLLVVVQRKHKRVLASGELNVGISPGRPVLSVVLDGKFAVDVQHGSIVASDPELVFAVGRDVDFAAQAHSPHRFLVEAIDEIVDLVVAGVAASTHVQRLSSGLIAKRVTSEAGWLCSQMTAATEASSHSMSPTGRS
jgi:hypothetical protein